jgi:hypothetical protein
MDKEDPKCEFCKAWYPLGTSGQGDCKRNAPQTFEGALKVWPRTMYNDGCWDIVWKGQEVLND